MSTELTMEEYDEAVRQLSRIDNNWVVCRSREEAQALAAWIEENDADEQS